MNISHFSTHARMHAYTLLSNDKESRQIMSNIVSKDTAHLQNLDGEDKNLSETQRCENEEEKKNVRKAANVKCMARSNQKKTFHADVRCMRDKLNYYALFIPSLDHS